MTGWRMAAGTGISRVHLEMERYFRAGRDLMTVIEDTEWEDMADEAV